MLKQLLKPLALTAMLVFAGSWLVQPALGQTVEPYGPYGYSPGAYDYTSSPRFYPRTYVPSYSYGSSFGNPTYSRYGYTPGAYDNSSPVTGPSQPYSYTEFSYAAPPERSVTTPLQPASRANDRTVRIQVRVPADAKIWVNDHATTSRGEVRTFESPPLDPAERYTYDLRATWQQNGRTIERTRHIHVRAGDRIGVNLVGMQTARTTNR
jgi:uncharacterized protein (TIGR03000 family)